MRKEILSLLTFCWAGLGWAQAQTGFQEPLPIQPPGMRHGAGAYTFAPRLPTYAPVPYPAYRLPAPVYAPPPGYRMPMPGQLPAYDPRLMPAAAQVPTIYGAPLPSGPPQPPSGAPEAAPPEPIPAPVAPPEPAGSRRAARPEVESPAGEVVVQGSPSEEVPAEPAEPFMVAPEGTWKPFKGHFFYGSVSYLRWLTKSQPIPASLSLSSSNQPTALNFSDQWLHGGQVLVGLFIDARNNLALEGGYFTLPGRQINISQTYAPVPLTIRPIFAGTVSDSSLVSTATDFSGAELNLRYLVERFDWGTVKGHLELLGGMRYADLSEAVAVSATTGFGTAPVLLSDAIVTTRDLFGTHNHLFMGQIGADAGMSWDRLSVNTYAKLGLGVNRQTVTIEGLTQVNGPPVLGNFLVSGGGFFAQPSNTGRFRRDAFCLLPEAGVNLGYKVGDHCRLGFGYAITYLTNVVRPGDHIDPTAGGAVRPALFFLGGARPQATFNNFGETTFWAQGINLTVEVNF